MSGASFCDGSPSGSPGRFPGLWLFVVLFVTIVRAVVVFSPGTLQSDPDSYQKVATELAIRGTFSLDGRPTAYRPPLYPLLLAGPILWCGDSWRWGVAGIHLLLGLATILLSASVAKRLFGSGVYEPTVVLVGLDPLLLHSSRLIMTETVSAFFAALTIWVAVGLTFQSSIWRWFFLGASVGACALTRPPFLFWPVGAVVVAGLLWAARRERPKRPSDQSSSTPEVTREMARRNSRAGLAGRRKWVCLVAAVVGMTVALCPWVIRNIVVFGRPIVGTTHGGYTFYLANNPDFYAFLSNPRGQLVWEAGEFNRQWTNLVQDVAKGDELAADRLAYRQAWDVIKAQPGMFAYSCVYRACQLWRPVPHQLDPAEDISGRLLRWAVGAFYLIEYVLAAVGLLMILRAFRHTAQGSGIFAFLVWGGGLMLTLTAVHTVYWSNIRMRAPLIPSLAVCAALGLQTLLKSITRRESDTTQL